MKKPLFFTLFLVLMQACMSSKPDKVFSIKSEKKVLIKEEAPAEFLYWELDNKHNLWALELGEINGLKKYQDTLKLTLGKQLYKSAIQNESTQNLDKKLIKTAEDGDRTNALLVHTGSLGKIRKINQLESQILNYQIEKYPMFSQPTEFHAFIVENKKKDKIRVYFGASNTEWPPHPTVLLEELEKILNKGWELTYHLHNHYCKKDKNYVGILAPSLADAQYFKMLKERFKLTKALITNGFHTVEIKNEDFEKFESH